MGQQGKPPTIEQIETIKATFAQTGEYQAAAHAANVSWGTARKYADNRDEFESLRAEKRVNIIARSAEVQIILLNNIVAPATLDKATLQEKANTYGIVTEKMLLMQGQATSRSDTVSEAAARLTPEQMEQAAKIRERLAGEVGS